MQASLVAMAAAVCVALDEEMTMIMTRRTHTSDCQRDTKLKVQTDGHAARDIFKQGWCTALFCTAAGDIIAGQKRA